MTLPAALTWRSRPGWSRAHLAPADGLRTLCGRRGRLELDDDRPRCAECWRINEKETT